MVHTSQKDLHWADLMMVGPYQELANGIRYYPPYPDGRTFGQKGCLMTSIAMALRTLNATDSAYRTTPVSVNLFFSDMNAMTFLPSKQTYDIDLGALEFWEWSRTVEVETEKWPAAQDELNAWLLSTETLLDNSPKLVCNGTLPPLGWLDRIPILLLEVPSYDMTSKWYHAVMVSGWRDGSYLVHDPNRDSFWEAMHYRWPAPEPICPTGDGSSYYITNDFTSMTDIYGWRPGVSEDGSSVIRAVVWLRLRNEPTPEAFKFILGSPAELFVTDPDGKSAGFNPTSRAPASGADARYYSIMDFDNPSDIELPEYKVLEFLRPRPGTYAVQVVGTGDGPYELLMRSRTASSQQSGTISTHEVQKLEVSFSSSGIAARAVSNFAPAARIVADAMKTQAGEAISFSGMTSFDADGQVVSYQWDFGDGQSGAGAQVQHSYSAPGSYQVTLTIQDDAGARGAASLTVTITAIPALPTVAIATMDALGNRYALAPFVGLASNDASDRAYVHFASVGTDPNGADPSSWTWRWDFGDGSAPVVTSSCAGGQACACTMTSCALWIPEVSDVTHEYRTPGHYVVTVTFNNGVGDSPAATAEVEILPALKRNRRTIALGSSCTAAGGELRIAGREGFREVRPLWEGGFSLGRLPLDDWLDNDRGRSMLVGAEEDWWVLKRVDVRLPDLSYEYTVQLPTDVLPGDYSVTVDASKDYSQYGPPPLKLAERPDIEAAVLVPLSTPCPAPSNLPPVPDAGGPYQGRAGAAITLDGRASFDPDGDNSALTFKWFISGGPPNQPEEGQVFTGPTPVVTLSQPGTYHVTLVVTDEDGADGFPDIDRPRGATTLTLTAEGNRPPDCGAAAASISKLWPPNHKLVDVAVTGITDPDGDPVAVTIGHVTQNEPTTGQGLGDLCPDAEGVGTAVVKLRAERKGKGGGRSYVLAFTALDGKGGQCTGEVAVCVPHDQAAGCAAPPSCNGRQQQGRGLGPVRGECESLEFDSTLCPR